MMIRNCAQSVRVGLKLIHNRTVAASSKNTRCLHFASPRKTDNSTEKLYTENKRNGDEDGPKPWEDPFSYALGPMDEQQKFTKVEVSRNPEEWKYVEMLMPVKEIPVPPTHESYPTPSGWVPPQIPPQSLPFYVRRNRNYLFPIHLEVRRDDLNVETMEFNYTELIVLNNIDGDVFECNNYLKNYLIEKVGERIATQVNEAQGKIRIRGTDRTVIEQFLLHYGF